MRRPWTLRLLAFFMLSLGMGGLYGGTLMLSDPTGRSLPMSEVLPLLHVPNYILPGLFLFGVMGLTPLLLAYALLARPNWPWAEALCRQGRQCWAWTGTLAVAVVLIIWLVVQVVLIGLHWPMQYITAGHGVIILLLVLTPGVKKFYAIKSFGDRPAKAGRRADRHPTTAPRISAESP